jgi:hypothetical protein
MSTSHAINAYEKKAPAISKWVWFGGSTALLEGQAVCYNEDYGTATAYDGRRGNRVELPSQANARAFAGVAAKSYNASTGGQLIEIYAAGSYANVLSKASTTLGAGRLTFEVGGTYAGYFRYAGLEGEGSCVPLQTVDRSTTAGKCFAKLEVGAPSGGVEVVTVTAGANVFMVGGTTLFAAADIASDATFTLADAVLPGLKKVFRTIGAVTTSNVVVTVTTGVMGAWAAAAAEPTAALATVTLNAADEETVLVFEGGGGAASWQPVFNAGATLA